MAAAAALLNSSSAGLSCMQVTTYDFVIWRIAFLIYVLWQEIQRAVRPSAAAAAFGHIHSFAWHTEGVELPLIQFLKQV